MSQDSAFDPNTFLTMPITETNERRIPLPVENPVDTQGLYTAVIGEVTMKSGTSTGKDGAPRAWLSAVVPLKLQIPQQLQDALKYQPEFTLADRPFIDLTPQNTIDNAPGRNRKQRQYREATLQNVAGQPWSWVMIGSKVVKVKLAHKILEDGAIIEEISGIFKS
jgi:RNase P protein component